MIRLRVLIQVAVVVFGMVGVAAIAFVGRERLSRLPQAAPDRLRAVGPHLLALAVLLALNSVLRDVAPAFSWIVGWNVTGVIHAVEGQFVGQLQSQLGHPWLTAYFSAVYVYGYAFLLVFPLLAYFSLDDDRPLRRTIVAYGLNYGLGLLCYLAFIAYGPRNLMPGSVESLLFTTYPKYQLLTAEVNSNTNVFPSLHTSLSVTVALLAAQTRATYRGWFYVSTVIASSVVVSTMYIGIHWATDVVAGAILAIVSVQVANWYVTDSN